MEDKKDYTSEEKYKEIITSIVSVAGKQVDGVASISWEPGALTDAYSKSRTKKTSKSINVEIVNDLVVIDISINAKLGYKVPNLVCELQEKLIAEVEKATRYKVKAVNVNIVGIAF